MKQKRRIMLKRLREEQRLNQTDVAYAVGVSPSTYSAWERGDREIKTNRLAKLSEYFGVTPNDILGYDGPGTLVPIYSEDERRLIELYRQISPGVRWAVTLLLKEVAKPWSGRR